jgi:hypothetical protein
MRRVAILISHANQEPFTSVLSGYERPSTLDFEEFRFDLFNFEGRDNGLLENWFRTNLEKFRYSVFWPALYLYDFVFLWIKAFFLPSAKLKFDDKGNRFLHIELPEDQRHIALKVYSSIQFCYEKNYDFILRTTTNSIFNLSALVDFLGQVEENRILYAGRKVAAINRPSFISGSFLVINRKAAKFLLSSRKKHNYGVLDDVAIGRIFSNTQVEIQRVFLESRDFPDSSTIKSFEEENLSALVHFRCKSTAKPRIDLELMLELSKLLKERGVKVV